jgi:hypothetical protein
MYTKRVFRIVPANAADRIAIRNILTSKNWFPEATSVPPLPGTYSNLFDYRQLLQFMAELPDGSFLVYTRKQYELADFSINVIPSNDWTNRYYCSIAPTIEVYNYTSLVNGGNTNTGIHTFRSYDYNLFSNDI